TFAWDQGKIGPGCPPIRTDAGWLVIYHGITPRVNAQIYKAGVALLDLHDPRKVIARAKEYIMAPREIYERVGDVPNGVFPMAAILLLEIDYDLAPTWRSRSRSPGNNGIRTTAMVSSNSVDCSITLTSAPSSSVSTTSCSAVRRSTVRGCSCSSTAIRGNMKT